MAINTYEMNDAIALTVAGLVTRTRAHYVELTDEDIDKVRRVMTEVLKPYVSNAMIENRQYNPSTDSVEEI